MPHLLASGAPQLGLTSKVLSLPLSVSVCHRSIESVIVKCGCELFQVQAREAAEGGEVSEAGGASEVTDGNRQCWNTSMASWQQPSQLATLSRQCSLNMSLSLH